MKPINTALCSFGMSGWVFHAPFLIADPHFDLHAVWERSKDLAQKKYPGIKTYRTLAEMLAVKNIELVIVNTPNYTHCDFTRQALLAGKHVIVEKPFCTTDDEAQSLIDLAKEQNRILSVYHNRRYDSDYRTVKKIIDSKVLGEIVEMEMHFDRYVTHLSPKLHKETPGPATGSLYDLGSHLIDQALQLFGMPEQLFADIRIVRPGSQVDDCFELIFYYPSLRVKIKSSYLVREPIPGYIIHGTKGSFIKAKTNVQEIALQAGEEPGNNGWGIEEPGERGLLHTEKEGVVIREHIKSEPGNYGDYYKEIYAAIRENGPVPVSGNEALDVIKIILAAHTSSKNKCVVNL